MSNVDLFCVAKAVHACTCVHTHHAHVDTDALSTHEPTHTHTHAHTPAQSLRSCFFQTKSCRSMNAWMWFLLNCVSGSPCLQPCNLERAREPELSLIHVNLALCVASASLRGVDFLEKKVGDSADHHKKARSSVQHCALQYCCREA